MSSDGVEVVVVGSTGDELHAASTTKPTARGAQKRGRRSIKPSVIKTPSPGAVVE
jgi:hypothetical protein